MPMPATEDLHRKAVELATDAASMVVSCRGRLSASHAYALGMECVRAAGRIQEAHRRENPRERARAIDEALRAALRAMFTLDRAAARATLPPEAAASLHLRLHLLARALEGLARDAAG